MKTRKTREYRCMGCKTNTMFFRKPSKCDICGDDEMVETGHVGRAEVRQRFRPRGGTPKQRVLKSHPKAHLVRDGWDKRAGGSGCFDFAIFSGNRFLGQGPTPQVAWKNAMPRALPARASRSPSRRSGAQPLRASRAKRGSA